MANDQDEIVPPAPKARNIAAGTEDMIHDPAQMTHLITVAQKEMDTVMKEKARAAMEETIKDVMVFTTKNKTNDDFEHQLLKQRRICNPEARELMNMYLMYRGQDEAPNTFLCCYRCKGSGHMTTRDGQ